MNRLAQVDESDSSSSGTLRRTITTYNDSDRRIVTTTGLLTATDNGLRSAELYDQLGKLRLSRVLDSSTQATGTDNQGIKVQTRYGYSAPWNYQLVSNPYNATTSALAGAEPTMGWTLSATDVANGYSVVLHSTGVTPPALPALATACLTGIAAAWVSGRQASCTTGLQTQTIDEAGISRTTTVDGLGRTSSVTEDGISATTSYSYDALGNLAGVKQGGFFPCVLAGVSYSRAFSYDSLGRLNTACNPESATTSYSYYGDGSLFTRADAESRVLSLNYDALGRLTHKGYSGSAATPAVDYAYVGTADFLSSVASSASTYTWANYDVLGRPATGTQTTPSVGGAAYNFTNLQWSPQGQLRSITYPSGRIVSTTPDAAGRAASVAGKADSGAAQSSYASSISYAAHGGIAGLTTGDLLTRTITYNPRLQMTQVQQGSLMTLGFTYDAAANNGNMKGAQITRGAFGATQTFTYDAVNRLKTAAEGAIWNQTYVYDAVGNRALTGNSSMASPGWTP